MRKNKNGILGIDKNNFRCELIAITALLFSITSNANESCPNLYSKSGVEAYEKKIESINQVQEQYWASFDQLEDDQIQHIVDKRQQELRRLTRQCLYRQIAAYSKPEQIDFQLLRSQMELLLNINYYAPNKKLSDILYEMVLIPGGDSTPKALVDSVEGALIATRSWDKAKELAIKFGLKTRIPLIQKTDRISRTNRILLQLDSKADILKERAFSWRRGGQIVVVGHPNCHFTRNAIKEILHNPLLKQLLVDKTTWIMPVHERLELDDVREWNQSQPIEFYYTQNNQQWPEIDYWATPTFYFYRDGKLVSQISGWPKEGRVNQLIKAAKAVGLLAEAGPGSKTD